MTIRIVRGFEGMSDLDLLLINPGGREQIYQELGEELTAVMLSQVLTLYITPVIYLYLDRFDRMLRRRLEPQLEEVQEVPPAVAAE